MNTERNNILSQTENCLVGYIQNNHNLYTYKTKCDYHLAKVYENINIIKLILNKNAKEIILSKYYLKNIYWMFLVSSLEIDYISEVKKNISVLNQ